MGDYTQSSITIIDWPRGTMVPVAMLEDTEDHLIPEDTRAGVAVEAIILSLLDRSGYRTTDYGFTMSDAELLNALREGATFTQEQSSYDAISNIEDRLIELGCTFEAHFEPKYEWDGEVILGTPGFPVFRTTANSDGSEYTMDSLISGWIEECDTLDEFRQRFEEHSGKEVADAVDEIRKRVGPWHLANGQTFSKGSKLRLPTGTIITVGSVEEIKFDGHLKNVRGFTIVDDPSGQTFIVPNDDHSVKIVR